MSENRYFWRVKKAVYLALGSNLGDKMGNIHKAYALIESKAGSIQKKSSLYRSEPWGFDAEDDFYNSAVLIETSHKPDDLLAILKEIESSLGRAPKTGKGYSSRIIDIDIIDFNGEIYRSSNLSTPHEGLTNRGFVLFPLQEINPQWIHPESGKNITDLIEKLTHDSHPEKLPLS